MTVYAGTMRGGRRRRGVFGRLLAALLAAFVMALAGAPIAYMLWPAPAPVAANAPSLPITIGGVVFNVPPAAIRVPMQRRPGAQPRIDLVFLWPSLVPPDAAMKPAPTELPTVNDRLFMTVAAADSTLPPVERLKIIYPRYTAAAAFIARDGLSVQGFRDGSPYQGEDLIYDAEAPERFLLRCTREKGPTPATCLNERRIGAADITVRFPREWLAEWRTAAAGIERLIASLRPAAPAR
jgi:hypothetical protein